jgi:DNA-binding transcriptional LysR family regulator
VQTATFGTLMTLLRASEIDLALCLAPDFTGTRGTEMLDLNFESLGRETVVPVAPANHPVLQGPATLAQLAGYGWTLPYQVSVVYRFESAFHRQGLDIPIQNLNATTPELVKQVSINAGLLTMLPLRMIQNDIDSGALVILPTPELRFEYLVALITLPKKLTESSQRFAGFLRDYAKTW